VKAVSSEDLLTKNPEFGAVVCRRERVKICNVCDKRVELGGFRICSACGCVIDLKVRFRNAVCPLKKW
jgi:RNA polymerase-binding transcription factor DksA